RQSRAKRRSWLQPAPARPRPAQRIRAVERVIQASVPQRDFQSDEPDELRSRRVEHQQRELWQHYEDLSREAGAVRVAADVLRSAAATTLSSELITQSELQLP